MGAFHGSLHAETWKLAESGRDRNQSLQPPMPGNTPNWGHCHTPSPDQSMESPRQSRQNQNTVEVHPETSSSHTSLLFHAVTVLARASKLYSANCVSCHGDHGAGDGPAAGALKPSPANFHVRQPSAERAWAAIEQGIPGSSMPAWKGRLSDDERHVLVRYVQSLYDSGREETQGK